MSRLADVQATGSGDRAAAAAACVHNGCSRPPGCAPGPAGPPPRPHRRAAQPGGAPWPPWLGRTSLAGACARRRLPPSGAAPVCLQRGATGSAAGLGACRGHTSAAGGWAAPAVAALAPLHRQAAARGAAGPDAAPHIPWDRCRGAVAHLGGSCAGCLCSGCQAKRCGALGGSPISAGRRAVHSEAAEGPGARQRNTRSGLRGAPPRPSWTALNLRRSIAHTDSLACSAAAFLLPAPAAAAPRMDLFAGFSDPQSHGWCASGRCRRQCSQCGHSAWARRHQAS